MLKNISCEHFKEVGLGYALDHFFASSPLVALKTIFPELKPWQTARAPKDFYSSEENQKISLAMYLQEKGIGDLNSLSLEEIHNTDFKSVATKKSLCDAGLRGLLAKYSGSPYRLFKHFYPRLQPWSFGGSKEAWKENPKETAAQAVRWLFEDYLNIPIDQIPQHASNKLFWDVGFSGILTNRTIGFNSSTYAAVDNAYPGKFSRSEFPEFQPTRKK